MTVFILSGNVQIEYEWKDFLNYFVKVTDMKHFSR